MDLGEHTSSQVAGITPTLVVPIGSVEQHGPHLPLDTDTRIAAALSGRIADRLGHLLAPAIAYGASGEHQGFPGTVSIGTAALTTVLVEYGRSACEWSARVVFVNGHGGNLDALRSAVRALRAEGREVVWVGGCTEAADSHAGHTETSVLLHLCPDIVRSDRLAAGNTESLAALMPRLRSGGVAAVSPSGVLGDPTTATPAEGERIFTAMVAECVRRVQRWEPGPDGMLT